MTLNFSLLLWARMFAFRNVILRVPFRRAFRFAVLQARASVSIASTRPAPKQEAAIAKIPLPVPASNILHPGCQQRVCSSSKRKHIAVVACSPVPKAVSAGMTIELRSSSVLEEGRLWPGEARIRSRGPIRTGFLLVFPEKVWSHPARSFSIFPPSFC